MFYSKGRFGACCTTAARRGPTPDWRFWIQTQDLSIRRYGMELAGVSFVVLFQELALIRWLPVEVRGWWGIFPT